MRDATPLLTKSGLSAAEVDYIRLLYLSGFGAFRIAEAFGYDRRAVENLVEYRGWRRQTPCRYAAPIAWRRPVLVRCEQCAARFGEELGKPRPCPHCGYADRAFVDPRQLAFDGFQP